MKKLNFLVIGPKVAVVLLPWLALLIFLSRKTKKWKVYLERNT
jgi:hypothetical protein